MQYVYPCNLTPDVEEGEGYVVTFPDVPEAITGAQTKEESLVLSEDALAVALGAYVENREDIPIPSTAVDGQVLVALPVHRCCQIGALHGHAPPRYHQCCPSQAAGLERVRSP